MKPKHLRIEGFLSYQQPVDIDFTQFELACITGENGAGKSSILDAMTWVLFGKARQVNESLINLQSDEAVVTFSFEYSGENYKIRRSNQRGKAVRLTLKTPDLDLTERTIRDTQNKIEEILSIDYDTFTNVVFFLQGESDKFVTASPGQRKQVLFDILGLAAWENYRLNAAAKIKGIEQKMEQSRGSVQVLEEDIMREGDLQEELKQVKGDVKVADHNQVSAQFTLDRVQKVFDGFVVWKDGQAELQKQYREAEARFNDLMNRRTLLVDQQLENQELMGRRDQIIKDYGVHKNATALLAVLDAKSTAWNKINNELSVLDQQLASAENDLAKIPDLEAKIKEGEDHLVLAAELTERVKEYQADQIKFGSETRKIGGWLEEKRNQYEELEGHDSCPLCEQKLKDPQKLIKKLGTEIALLKTERAAAKEGMNETTDKMIEVQAELHKHNEYGKQVAAAKQLIAQIKQTSEGVDRLLIEGFQAELDCLEYDPTLVIKHQEVLNTLSDAPREHGMLESVEKIGSSLQVQIDGLQKDQDAAQVSRDTAVKERQTNSDKYPEGYEEKHQATLTSFEAVLVTARQDYDQQVKREGQVEAALQKIETQKTRLEEIREKEKENTELHQKFSSLQEAFSKKGVPALLVEQSLPQIESKANQLLNRLSNGSMAVHFITQKAYSDASREDMKETLDIEIQDQAGIRDYEMYSGGESFRINFAVRMALSHVLANRSGAKLRTLVIDEGFGSQDAGGRDRLINSINTVKEEYDKVLVITHIPEVIESFPVQLRVEKGPAGSTVRVL